MLETIGKQLGESTTGSTTGTTTGSTIGSTIGLSSVAQRIENLVGEVQNINSHIEGPRDGIRDLAEPFKVLIDSFGQYRGRPLHYPYVGSGAGRGPYVELEDGSVKLDLINGIGIHLFGHSHPRVMAAAVRGAIQDVINQGNLQPNKEYGRFLEMITTLAAKSSRLKYGWLSTCGSMANESALKIVRQKKTPARKVITFKDAFAGRSTMMAEITENAAYKVGLPNYNEVLRLPFGNKNASKALALAQEYVAANENNICCFVFEPMLGEGGYRVANSEFFLPLLKFFREQKIPIWADEIQTFSRTGELFAFETLGIGEYVDICTIAKTAQLGVTLYTEELNPKPGLIAGTFSGGTSDLLAGMEIIKMIVNEGYLGQDGKIAHIHKSFIGMLNQLNATTCKGLLNDAEGLGLMIAVTPYDGSKEKTDALLKRMYQNHLIAFGCGHDPYRVRFLIPAVMTERDILIAEKIIEKSVLEG